MREVIPIRKTLRNSFALLLRHSMSFSRRESFARAIHKRYFSNLPEEDHFVYAKLRDGSMLRVDLRMECLSFYLGEYEPGNLTTLLSFLPADGTFIDLGANIGFIAVPLAHRRRESCVRVYAFEPVTANYLGLLENIKLNGLEEKIFPVNLAVSNVNGRLPMQIFADHSTQTGNAAALTTWTGRAKTIGCEVDAVRFDDWIKTTDIDRVDVMKLDVEGHEVHVFEGMMETLKKYRPVIYSECNAFFFKEQRISTRQVFELLAPLGYEFHRYADGKLKQVMPVPEGAEDLFLIPR